MPLSNGIALLAAGAAVVFTGVLALQRNLYVSALSLLGVLLMASVLFYFSGAPLLAFLQIMIYAGAVMVLVVVAIMAAPIRVRQAWSKVSVPRPLAVLGALLPAAGLAVLLAGGPPPVPAAAAAEQALGSVLFGPYALATEAVTVLMLLAALAVVEDRR